jgi:hypothetical protein
MPEESSCGSWSSIFQHCTHGVTFNGETLSQLFDGRCYAHQRSGASEARQIFANFCKTKVTDFCETKVTEQKLLNPNYLRTYFAGELGVSK